MSEHSPGADRETIIIGPPPTPNGDLHVGHLAGPYLAADVYARYLRVTGRRVIYCSGTDDSQTYVLAKARRSGTTPEALCETSSRDIRRTLDLMGIALDGFAPFDDGYRSTVLDFLGRLHAAGRFRLRTVRLPYAAGSGEYLMEGLLCGECPVCLAESRGGLCETCGHPNNFDELIDPRSTIDRDEEVTMREATILVLPLEEYREELTAYHAARAPYWRPHIVQLMREVLARPLPDFPITYPTGWGIPAPFPETPGQVLNAWAEGMPASMYCTAWAAEQMGEPAWPSDRLWRATHDAELVYFLGFDNAYFWGLTHLALLLAHEGRYIVPDTIVCNEFYELENEKFSTSKGHVVWAQDLVADVPRDFVRFYISLSAPENQRTNFSRFELDKVVGERVVTPWQRLARALNSLTSATTSAIPTSEEGRAAASVMVDRFRSCYGLQGFSLCRAADLVVVQLERLSRRAAALADGADHPHPELVGDLVLQLKALLGGTSPILIDLTSAIADAAGLDLALTPEAFDVSEIRPFVLPLIGALHAKPAEAAHPRLSKVEDDRSSDGRYAGPALSAVGS